MSHYLSFYDSKEFTFKWLYPADNKSLCYSSSRFACFSCFQVSKPEVLVYLKEKYFWKCPFFLPLSLFPSSWTKVRGVKEPNCECIFRKVVFQALNINSRRVSLLRTVQNKTPSALNPVWGSLYQNTEINIDGINCY